MRETRKLLAVSWELPPMYGPRATQVARTLSQLASLGWHSTVVCLDPRRGGPHWRDGVDAAFPTGVETVRVSSPEEWTLVRAAWRILPSLRDRPDSKWVWIGRAARAATRASATATFDGLVTFGQPWSDHLVGLRVHRATSLPWVAHFSDPWVDSPYVRSSPARWRAARRMEEDVIREADGVVFVTGQMADLVMKKYPEAWRDKAGVVPHGFDPMSLRKRDQPRRDGGPMRLVYTGRFYEGLRTPTSMLRALGRINAREPLADALDVTFVGPHVTSFAREAAQLGVDALVHFRDRVPPAEATAIASAADALLVIDAPADGPSPFLPSKLVDYLPLRKPILGITPAGATAELLERLVCRTAPPDDVDAIETAIVCLLRQWREGTLSVSPEFDRVASEFDIRHTTAQLAGLLTRAFDRDG
jgi:glycosyltransferase involved in cell wall biosynthesis